MNVDITLPLTYPRHMSDAGKKFEELVEIMARLRAPNGCPWDREQSYKDIAAHTLEETHEVLEAIDKEDYNSLCEELGDLLLQILFYAQIASEEGRFTINDVIAGIQKKLIHRHPHVFGKTKVSGSSEVLKQWEHLKKAEGKSSVVGGVPASLPALLKAFRLGEKTSRVGFDWPTSDGILAKIEEEAHELHDAKKSYEAHRGKPRANRFILPLDGGGSPPSKRNINCVEGGRRGRSLTPSPFPLPSRERVAEPPQQAAENHNIDHEYGDLLFTLANLGRFLKIDPEGSLRRATNRFITRFKWIEKEAKKTKRELRSLSDKEWDKLWNEAKKHVK